MKKSAKSKPILSVIILNYNSGHYLADCLQSLSQSDTSNFSLETIVIDNASTDDSVSKIKKLLSEAKSSSVGKIVNCKLKINKTNAGFSAGNNIGVKMISPQTQYVLFLNPDTKVEKNTLSKMISFFEKNPHVSAATCKVILATTNQIQPECHRDFPTPLNAFLHFSGISSRQYFMEYLDYSKIQKINACVGAFLMIRRKVGESIGWWNEKYFFYGEDLDLCYKLRQKKYQLYYYPHCQIIHYQGISSGIISQSQKLSAASRQTKLRSALASTQAMRIFYQENLFHQYPPILRSLTLLGIKILEIFRVIKAKYL